MQLACQPRIFCKQILIMMTVDCLKNSLSGLTLRENGSSVSIKQVFKLLFRFTQLYVKTNEVDPLLGLFIFY